MFHGPGGLGRHASGAEQEDWQRDEEAEAEQQRGELAEEFGGVAVGREQFEIDDAEAEFAEEDAELVFLELLRLGRDLRSFRHG